MFQSRPSALPFIQHWLLVQVGMSLMMFNQYSLSTQAIALPLYLHALSSDVVSWGSGSVRLRLGGRGEPIRE